MGKSPTEIDYSLMTDPELIESCGDDGMAWAKAFSAVKKRMGWDIGDIDEGLMVAWFANAIEASWARRVKRAEPQCRPEIS